MTSLENMSDEQAPGLIVEVGLSTKPKHPDALNGDSVGKFDFSDGVTRVAVADGVTLSGSASAAAASEKAIDFCREKKNPTKEDLGELNREMINRKVATTLVYADLNMNNRGNRYLVEIFNLGSSAAFTLYPGSRILAQLTEEHSKGNILTKGLGIPVFDDEGKATMVEKEGTLDADTINVSFRSGDLLLLASDGVHKVLGFDKMQTLITVALDDGKTAQEISDILVNAALEAGSVDDCSAVIAMVKSKSDPNITQIDQQLHDEAALESRQSHVQQAPEGAPAPLRRTDPAAKELGGIETEEAAPTAEPVQVESAQEPEQEQLTPEKEAAIAATREVLDRINKLIEEVKTAGLTYGRIMSLFTSRDGVAISLLVDRTKTRDKKLSPEMITELCDLLGVTVNENNQTIKTDAGNAFARLPETIKTNFTYEAARTPEELEFLVARGPFAPAIKDVTLNLIKREVYRIQQGLADSKRTGKSFTPNFDFLDTLGESHELKAAATRLVKGLL